MYIDVYLDNSATTQVSPKVIDRMVSSMKSEFYNPSSLYEPSVAVRKDMDACRDAIRSKTGLQKVVFTSGGTEANNLAIMGLPKGGKRKKILVSMAEHPSVVEACKALQLGFEVLRIPLTGEGLVDLHQAKSMMDAQVALICVMEVSNEIGSIQPIMDLLKLRAQLCPDARFHVDGVQGFLKLPINRYPGIDSYTVSAHKIHGPKGVGALAYGTKHLHPLALGGGQENGMRSGTENTPGIVGLHAAIECYPKDHHMRDLKLHLWNLISNNVEGIKINGPSPDSKHACDHILNISFPFVMAQTLMHTLEKKGVYVSHGSACASRSRSDNPTLTAMGISSEQSKSAIRISLSPYITKEQIEYAADAMCSSWRSIQKYRKK